MKKLILIFVLLILVPFIPYHLSDAEAEQGTCGTNVKYTISGNTIEFSFENSGSNAFWEDCSSVFKDNSAITVVNIKDTIQAPENSSELFKDCIYLTEMDLSKLDVSNVTDMRWLFYGCSSLSDLNVSGWNTSNVTDMMSIFYNCSSLKSLDVSKWNTASVTNISWIFYGCSSLSDLNVSGWNTSNVTEMQSIFYNCTSLKRSPYSIIVLL